MVTKAVQSLMKARRSWGDVKPCQIVFKTQKTYDRKNKKWKLQITEEQ